MVNIKYKHWDYTCGEPNCCYEYGVELIVNEESITDYCEISIGDIRKLFKALKIDFAIEEIYETGETFDRTGDKDE